MCLWFTSKLGLTYTKLWQQSQAELECFFLAWDPLGCLPRTCPCGGVVQRDESGGWRDADPSQWLPFLDAGLLALQHGRERRPSFVWLTQWNEGDQIREHLSRKSP